MGDEKNGRINDEEAMLRLLTYVLADDEPSTEPLPRIPQGESLGSALSRLQSERGWSSKRMALAIGVPQADLQRWKADLDVPDEASMFRICDALDSNPLRVLPMVEQTARNAMHRLLDEARGAQHAVAARQRGPVTGDADRVLGMRVPLPVRRVMARKLETEPEAHERIGQEVRRLAGLDERGRDMAVAGFVAMMLLEGEEDPGLGEFQ